MPRVPAYKPTPRQLEVLARARAARSPEQVSAGIRRWHIARGHMVANPTDEELRLIAIARAAKAGE